MLLNCITYLPRENNSHSTIPKDQTSDCTENILNKEWTDLYTHWKCNHSQLAVCWIVGGLIGWSVGAVLKKKQHALSYVYIPKL